MKSAIASFLSLLLGAFAGYALFAVLGLVIGFEFERNPLPIAICAGAVLLASGYAYGRWFHTSILPCVLGAAAYAGLVYAAVAYLGGTVGGIYFDWFFAALAVSIVPWMLGIVISRFGRK